MVKYRVFVLKGDADPSELAENLGNGIVSTKKLKLYGRNILLVWPDSGKHVGHPDIEFQTSIDSEFILSSREWKRDDTMVDVGGVRVGKDVTIAAGPCSIDFTDNVEEFAAQLKKAGADIIRGGAYKPRTSPFSFQGKGTEGLDILKKMGEASGLPVVSEILDSDNLKDFKGVDLLQIGSRNAQNFQLLRKVARDGRPILLKRGMGNTYTEWMATADYVMSEGNGSVILCERGIRTFENATRFTLDIGSIARAKNETHLPICADPSHPAGTRELVIPMALSSVASGADMLLVEVHPNPDLALSDGKQQITVQDLARLSDSVKSLRQAIRV